MHTKKKLIKSAVDILRGGGMVIFPTETAYALGCDALNTYALKKLFQLKKRDAHKTVPMIVDSLSTAKKFTTMSEKEIKVAKKYWPGPVTLILKAKSTLPKEIVSTRGEIALRVPSQKDAYELARTFKKPIVSTSANISGKNTCYSQSGIEKQFKKDALDTIYWLSKKTLKRRKPSTLIRIKNNKIEIVRQGSIIPSV